MRASSVTCAVLQRDVEVDADEHGHAALDLRSRSVFLPNVTPVAGTSLEDLLRQLDDAVRVAPLVVVPGDDLHQPVLDAPSSAAASKIDEYGDSTMSEETIGSSVYWRMPVRSPGVGLLLEDRR